ncbi:MAG: malate dehydrogenase [Candidatus Dormibacteraeota bacterium]|nr:malate dehydrogenase [Candidatus Dormibacteraeota bacterium]MBO0745702.1 malate dehydrogenase [Candidatus Dormibacteraeota bacterium]
MSRYKVTVVGAGNVGATTAQRLAERDYCNVVLIDIVEGMPQGKALDIEEAAPVYGYDSHVVGANDYRQAESSDLVVITSGIARKPGMSRDDLLDTNAKIVTSVTQQVVAGSPDAVLIVVANPLDAMVTLTHRVSGFPRERVVGMAGVLDSARYRTFIAHELGISVEDVHGFVLGGHGDTMVPLPRYTSVAGVPLPQLVKPERIEEIVQRTRDGGAEITALLKTGSAYYAPSAAVVEMVDAILLDKKRVLPAAALLQGEYGIDGIFLGVPVLLGKGGVERVIEIELTPEEKAQLEHSAAAVREIWGATERVAGLAS